MILNKILPPSITDKDLQAISAALDDALDFICQNKNLVLLLYNLDSLPSDALDHIATQWHVDFYNKNLPVNIKRNFIKQSLYLHKIKGTPAAVKRVLDIFTTNPSLEEWFQYGGEPYFFKISFNSMIDIGDGDITFWRMLFDSKNVRSWLESITINLPDDIFPHYHAIAEPVGGNSLTVFDLPPDISHNLYHAIAEPVGGNSLTSCIDISDINISLFCANGEMLAGIEIFDCDFL